MKRGKESAVGLATVTALPLVKQLPPPDSLTQEEKDIWISVTDTMPADWFTDADAPLLVDYCRGVIRQNHLAERINSFGGTPADKDEYKMYSDLLKDSCRLSQTIKTAAASLRLTQQSRYMPRAAATANKKSSKPWQKD